MDILTTTWRGHHVLWISLFCTIYFYLFPVWCITLLFVVYLSLWVLSLFGYWILNNSDEIIHFFSVMVYLFVARLFQLDVGPLLFSDDILTSVLVTFAVVRNVWFIHCPFLSFLSRETALLKWINVFYSVCDTFALLWNKGGYGDWSPTRFLTKTPDGIPILLLKEDKKEVCNNTYIH